MGFGGGNDLGFGIAINLSDGYSAVARQVSQSHNDMVYTIERGMENLTKKGMSTDEILQQNAKQIQNSGQMMASGFAMMGAGIALLAPVGIGLKYAAEFELAEAGLTTLLKSTEKAKEVMANVKEDAAKSTMFGFQELLRGNQLLISTGISAERARIDINALADAVAATGGGNAELMRMSVNLQQIKSAGKATALDIRQFAYAGIDIYGLLSDSLGVTTDKVKDLDITYDMLTAALKRANEEGGRFEGASARMSETLAGKWAAFKDQMIFAFAEIGMAVKPFVVPIIDVMTALVKGLAWIAQTPVGKVLLGVVVTTGLLLIAMGGLVTVMGFVRGAAFRMSSSLIAMGMTEVATIFTTAGLAAGFKALAVAVWVALAPLLPFILAAVAIVAIGYGLSKMLDSQNGKFVGLATIIGILLGPIGQLIVAYKYLSRGIEEFKGIMDGTVEAQGGFIGFMQKIGGIAMGVSAIFSSWNGNTFELSEKMHDALQKVGILDFVLALGTWVVRIKEFMQGFISPFVNAYEQIAGIFSQLAKAFEPIMGPASQWGQLIEKATGSTDLWNAAGKVMGTIVAGMIFPLVTLINVLAFVIEMFTDFDSAWGKVTGTVDSALGYMSELAGFGGDDEEGKGKGPNMGGKIGPNPKGPGGVLGLGTTKNNIQASTVNNNKTESTGKGAGNANGDMHITLEMDGDVLHKKIVKMQNDEDSRN